MAYFLRKIAANSNLAAVNISSRINFMRAGSSGYTGNFELEFELQMTGTSLPFISQDVTDGQRLLIFTNETTLEIRRPAGNISWTLPTSAVNRCVYRVVGNASDNTIQLFQNGSPLGTRSGADFILAQNLFAFGSNTRNYDFYYLKIFNNGVLAHNYDPSASNGTGTTLIDTVGGNNGTLVNFPTNNSQWVFYDDGAGGEYTATISSTTFLPTSLVSATNTKPEYSASLNSTTLLPLSSIVVESTRPQYSATIASNALLPTSTVVLDSVTPAYSVSIVGSTLLPTSSVGLDNETPQNSVIVNSTTLLPIGTVQLSDIKPEYVLSVSGATPLPTSTVMLTPLGAGDYVTTIASSALLPQGGVELDTISPVGLSIASNTPLPFSSVVLDCENYSISVSSSTLLPVGSVELGSVIPEYSLDISSSTKLPTSIVVLINGEIVNYTNPKHIVTLTYRKGVSKLTVPNSNIKPIYSNNIIKLRN